VAHLCTECGYKYPKVEFQATPPDQRQCPDCGSARINASVCAVVAVGAVVSVSTPSILMTTHLWPTWMRIAIDHARAACDARTEVVKGGLNNETAEWMRIEFEASVVAVAASAHALDALYGSTVIPPEVRTLWAGKRTRRPGKIREALKLVFVTDAVNSQWVTEFEWLFVLRDAATHAEESPKSSVPHPLGTNTAPEQVDYSMENATKAVELALSVLRWCVDHPRRDLADAVQWAEVNKPTMAKLETEWTGQ
jgi:predicted  nucleic acid-binding Zn-ribbon protein